MKTRRSKENTRRIPKSKREQRRKKKDKEKRRNNKRIKEKRKGKNRKTKTNTPKEPSKLTYETLNTPKDVAEYYGLK